VVLYYGILLSVMRIYLHDNFKNEELLIILICFQSKKYLKVRQ